MPDQDTSITWGVKSTFHRTVIRACRHCGAPGRFLSHPSIRDGWPGCYVEPDDHRNGMNILEGDCPNCGKPRPPVEELPTMNSQFVVR